MSRPSCSIARCDLERLRQFRLLPNLTKIPLFIGLMIGLGFIAWNAGSPTVLWIAYIGMGYMWMGMVTFMHDALHYTLFRRRWANWVFGVLCMLPIFATFVGFREDHIEHHRHNRSPRDPGCLHDGTAWRTRLPAVLCIRQ